MQEHNELRDSGSGEIRTTSLQPMDFTDILNGMFNLYRSHFGLFFSIMVAYLVLGYAIDMVSVFLVTTDPIMSVIVLGLSGIFSFMLFTLVAMGLAYASAHIYLSREMTAGAALQQAWRRFWTYFGASLLLGLVEWGLSITIIGLPFALYFGVRWGLYTFPVVFEETGARHALKRSTELVKGSWWRVFGILLVITLIMIMIAFILSASAELLLNLLGVTESAESTGPTGLLETIRDIFAPTPRDIGWYAIWSLVTISINALVMPIGVVGYALLYFDLRILKEAFDIEM